MSKRPEWHKLISVYEKVPAYRRLLEENSSELFPIIEREKMTEDQSSCIMPEYFHDYLAGQLFKARTSGSTGQYLEIFWNKEDYMKSMVELWLLRVKFYDIYPHNRLFFFFTENESGDCFIERKNEFGISKKLLVEEQLKVVYESILAWNPEWMILQPSTAVILCEYYKRNNLQKPSALRYIEFNGELLTDEVRNLTKEVFECQIANQYGANEVNSIAFECPYGKMHVLSTNVFLEIVDEDGNLITDSSNQSEERVVDGRIIITSLRNHAMPFIRYDIGDRGKLFENHGCRCGCKNKILELSTGRNNDYVLWEDGERANSYIFVRIFDMINKFTDDGIIQFYVEQKNYDEFFVMIYKDEEVSEEQIIEAFYDSLEEKHLVHAHFLFEFTERLFEVRGQGKYMYFKSFIEKH